MNTNLLFNDFKDTIQNLLIPLKKLYKEKKIDKTLYNVAKTQAEYHFAKLELTGLRLRYSYYKNSNLKPPEKWCRQTF